MAFTQWKGIFPYLVSPVDEDGNVKEQVLRNLVDHLIACGVHGLTPLGSTGEFFYLDWEQRREIVRIVVEAAAHRVPVVAGVAASTNRDAAFQASEFERNPERVFPIKAGWDIRLFCRHCRSSVLPGSRIQ